VNRIIQLLPLIALLAGCTTALNRAPTAGDMNQNGTIQPCSERRDAQACGDAVFNAALIGEVHKGQSRDDVRSIMQHNAERFETQGVTESWGYMTSYRKNMLTWITFSDDRVISLSHEEVKRQ
jgi:hypothetical protein